MAEQKVESGRIATGAVTGDKVAVGAIRGNNIVANTITGNLIPAGAVSTNHIVVGAITGNLIPARAVTTNHIVVGAITGNLLAPTIVGSNNLLPNLTFSMTGVFETANVYTTAVGGNTNIDILNNTVYFFTSNTTGNVTFNIRGNSTVSLANALSVGSSVSLAILLKQGTTSYKANVFIDGALITPYWLSNTSPVYAVGTQESIDNYNFSILKTAINTYTVLASNSKFNASYQY
jgi:hypothetical protein